MLSQKLLDAINDQITFELYSGHIYLSMAAYCAEEGLDGFVNFFTVQEQEERFHGMKFFNYVVEREGRVRLGGFEAPLVEFDSLLDVFETALEHEKIVTKRIYNLMDIALEERDHASVSFLNWYVNEQVEEESTFSGLITKLKRIGDNNAALLNLDAELAARTFTPPAAE